MMKDQSILRDERYYSVENASYRIGYIILAFGLLVVIIIRSIAFQESSWDLFALLIISGFAATLYQAAHKIISFSWKWLYFFLGITLLAAAVAYILATLAKSAAAG
jgi:uncharacterized membrane protein